jgi:L,D-peptidoglycan transpeptidase YkuD (ErfK/YbiS/YcfS/YnhG family)
VTSDQAIVLHASGYDRSIATLTAYQRAGDGWQVVFGPWSADIGRAGVAPPGAKREGDGRTPSGTYAFDFAFGVDADPGVRLPFRAVTGPNIVWDDDPNSPRYNLWVDTNQADAGARPEPMDVRPVYSLGAVIGYNQSRTPGLGSAIFLHVSQGSATSGCVALPAGQLRSVLLWLDPARSPVIVISAG